MMENNDDFPSPFLQPRGGNQQLLLVPQLMQQMKSMQHIDEVFLWLANAMLPNLNAQVIQFWANQAYEIGIHRKEIRATACRDSSLPQSVYMGTRVVEFVEHTFAQEQSIMPRLVTSIFSPYEAQLLANYDLRYWAGYFLKSDVLLPSAQHEPTVGKIATPLSMVVSFFTQQPPSQNFMRAAGFLLNQSIRIAKTRGLFSVATQTVSTSSPASFTQGSWQQPHLKLFDLVPHRTLDMEAVVTQNPFATAVDISEKNARRLYDVIDGRKSVARLVQLTQFDEQEVIKALQYLIQHKHIQLCEPGGKPVESETFLGQQ